MGERGPPKKPTALQVIRGNPGKRKVKKDEPEVVDLPKINPPKGMTAKAKKTWDKIAPALHHAGLLKAIDGQTLIRYCETYADWQRARKSVNKLREAGSFTYEKVTKDSYSILPHPDFQNEQKLSAALLVLEREFGMTPAARTRISVDLSEEKGDDLDSILGNGTSG